MPYLSVGAGWQDGNGLIHRGQQRPQGQADLLADESTPSEVGAFPFTHGGFYSPLATVDDTPTLFLCPEPDLISSGVIFPPRFGSECSSLHAAGERGEGDAGVRNALLGLGWHPGPFPFSSGAPRLRRAHVLLQARGPRHPPSGCPPSLLCPSEGLPTATAVLHGTRRLLNCAQTAVLLLAFLTRGCMCGQ